ncbi:hypothetical protein FHS25_006241 [Rhizobium laguerreae]|uniref:Uncharacterized protein n=1 Tax=Rhizobium laguerreae TaxID=1076926 RepID=A0ABR6GHF8_9HYPH|nr:hypothetical protein [Rhizobium laguerreae]MBB3165729.1 hypothetical protein [Rhizobium laguerreae]OOO46574.1 hypothetical protein BS630_23280 [Rhizobium laguerreae]
MSRYTIAVTRTASRHADPDAIIGYDRPLQTFFLQAFPDTGGENLELWLGTDFREFETLSQLRSAAIALGFDFIPLASGILHRLLEDHARKAQHAVGDTIIQDILNGTSAR